MAVLHPWQMSVAEIQKEIEKRKKRTRNLSERYRNLECDPVGRQIVTALVAVIIVRAIEIVPCNDVVDRLLLPSYYNPIVQLLRPGREPSLEEEEEEVCLLLLNPRGQLPPTTPPKRMEVHLIHGGGNPRLRLALNGRHSPHHMLIE